MRSSKLTTFGPWSRSLSRDQLELSLQTRATPPLWGEIASMAYTLYPKARCVWIPCVNLDSVRIPMSMFRRFNSRNTISNRPRSRYSFDRMIAFTVRSAYISYSYCMMYCRLFRDRRSYSTHSQLDMKYCTYVCMIDSDIHPNQRVPIETLQGVIWIRSSLDFSDLFLFRPFCRHKSENHSNCKRLFEYWWDFFTSIKLKKRP